MSATIAANALTRCAAARIGDGFGP